MHQKNPWAPYLLGALFHVLLVSALSAQGTPLPFGNPAYHILDRLAIKTGLPTPFHPSLKFYTRGDAVRYAMAVDTAATGLTTLDRQDLQYIFRDNNEWLVQAYYANRLTGPKERVHPDYRFTQIEESMEHPYYERNEKAFLGFLYPTPANMLEVNEKFFHLRVNPILNLKLGAMQNEDEPYFYNLRGLELRGAFDDRIYFYANILETQARFPNYVNTYIRKFDALPGNGFLKSYQSDLLNITNGRDFLNGQGYLGFNISRHLGLQFGYGRHVIGNGYRSLLLSDFANNYLYLKLNWRVGKFHYQNLFAELTINPDDGLPGDNLLGKKYMATHHLSLDILPNLSVGLFETVVFSRPNHFEFQYLLPFILYRVVEQGLGSPDNVMLGFDARWNLWQKVQVYGQFILDEFKFNELITNNRGWWANKYGLQLGAKYINALGVDHLDLQVEFNTLRPYTYTHVDSVANYSHYHQALAHPLGANLREFLVVLRYQPLHRLTFEGRFIRSFYGEDTETSNWGMNILLDSDTREQDYGNEIGQGIATTTNLFGFDASYMLTHNVFLDLHYFYRRKDSAESALDQQTQYVSGGIRVNIGKVRMDF